MNKKVKFLATSLCGLVLAFSLSLANANAATIHTTNSINKNIMSINSNMGSSYGAIFGYATQDAYLLNNPSPSCTQTVGHLSQGTRFQILESPGRGWYYGAYGSDYNGWTYGWIQSEYISNITVEY
ncbi:MULTISPECIES: SH3 domain-containing protein [Clostridium]|uniref:SH3 domain-containing protein n=1 Tax=Clostridium TaxID=1485 RepID=UPI0008247954|nr:MULTISPECIES: SH3 domain-containing protein [Clostridium]PJI10026.1 SH3 domain-containing protein [Clostridium sp. CT7]